MPYCHNHMLTKPVNVFLLVLAVEAMLSVVDLSQIPGVTTFLEVVGDSIPVVNHFRSNPAADKDVGPYIAITLLLFPLKSYAAFAVISRLTKEDRARVICYPSSDASFIRKLVSSAIVVSLNVGLAWYVFFQFGEMNYFGSLDIPRSATAKYHLVNAAGIQMWVGWSVMHLVVTAFLVGLLFVFVAEWIHKFNCENNS